MVWTFAAAMAALGKLNGEFIAAGLISGLVLIVLLMGFTVTQFAFRTGDTVVTSSQDGAATRNYAIEGAGAATWEWSSKRGEIATGTMMEEVLGLQRGELSCGLDDWLAHLRTGDREKLRAQIETLAQRGSGHIQSDFQMRSGDGSYRWFALRAGSLPTNDQKGLRCVGLLREITREKKAHERMVTDAVRDNLTGLPNRELFLDRLDVGFARSRQDSTAGKVALLVIEIDRFEKLQEEFGAIRADSMLLTTAKRLARNVGPQDSLARIDSDQFAILMGNGGDAREVAMFAERVRRSVRSPMKFSGREVVLTASTGIAGLYDDQVEPADLLRDAELALFKAKRGGIDKVEVFQPAMRAEKDDRGADAGLLRKAMERKQIFALYQPIYSINPERLAGFECVLRWEHPTQGAMGPSEFMRIAEQGGIAQQLALQIMEQAAKDAVGWHKAVPRADNPLFVTINLGDRLPLEPEFVQEIRNMLGRTTLPKGCLRLEVSDSAIRQNPERGVEVLDWLRNAGAGAVLTDFGAGQVPLGDLSRLALDGIRLDRWLCFDALGDGPGAPLVRGIAALARELGRPVIADGVETPDDVAALRAAGCSLALGPLYGDPMSERQLEELLAVVRKAEQKNAPRGIFGAGILSRAKTKETPAAASSQSNGAARTARKQPAAPGDAPTEHLNGDATRGPAVNGRSGTGPEAVDYDEAVAAEMLASAHDAARHYEQPVELSRAPLQPATETAPAPPATQRPVSRPAAPAPQQTASVTTAISEAVAGHLQEQAAQRPATVARPPIEPADVASAAAPTMRRAATVAPPASAPPAAAAPPVLQPAQLVNNSSPTVLPMAPAPVPIQVQDVPPTQRSAASAVPPPPAYPPAPGLARLQRGAFGTRPSGSVGMGAPTAAALAAAAAATVVATVPTSTPSAAALDAQGQPPVGLTDTMPDGDVLRGLAQRLEAALRREGR
jgi:diguanylate cyclase (GGDEF)-like protein/PAS domain S-box-containing protein